MKKIKVTKYGIIHYYASCRDCDWVDSIVTDEKNRNQKLRNEVYKHVYKTGHTITIEGGTSTDYSLME